MGSALVPSARYFLGRPRGRLGGVSLDDWTGLGFKMMVELSKDALGLISELGNAVLEDAFGLNSRFTCDVSDGVVAVVMEPVSGDKAGMENGAGAEVSK